ncbi:MAG: phosphotransferase family protein [Planctomycetota bacterium]|jgi:aminoglycoside phosphotransferase (APT) family kinase protein
MIEIDATTTLDYLRGPGCDFLPQVGLTPADLESATAKELAWGVSNIVIRVDAPDAGRSFVVKQSREKLRTQIDWFSQLERIWREVDMLHALRRLLPDGAVPAVLFEDRDNYLFAMEAIEADHRVWKAELLDGHFDPAVADNLAACLAAIHRGSTGNSELAELLGNRTVFDELRLDPFYRYVAEHDEVCRPALESIVESSLHRSDALVLADFSPKNILLTTRGPVLVDFETGHFGDPAFDIGFFLSHLLLKVVYHSSQIAPAINLARVFEDRYFHLLLRDQAPDWATAEDESTSDYERRCVRHLGACMLARVAGKSRVDYLREDWQPDFVTRYCHGLLTESGLTLKESFEWLQTALRERETMT